MLKENVILLLHWGILFEIADGYARLAKGIQLLKKFASEEDYSIREVTEPLLNDALALYTGRPDKEWSLTDCVSFVLMHQMGITEAVTADVHFRQAGFTALLLGPT